MVERLQLFTNVPFGWANSERSIAGLDDFSNRGGIGDVRFGGNFLARQGGAYITDYRFENQRIAGSSLEPVQMRFAVTISQKKVITEPFAEIGATRDAASWRGGIIWTY